MADSNGVDGIIRLGCPFHGRYPERHKKFRSCGGAGFTKLFQVKGHLNKVHPPKCPKCSFAFAGHSIEEHASRHPSCEFKAKDVEYMTEKQWQDIRVMPRRCRSTSSAKQWRVMFRILFGNNVSIPPAYLPSVNQYRRIAANPSPALLSALQTKLLTSNHTVPFQVNEDSVRFCLGHVLPAFLDSVGELEYLSGTVTLQPVPQTHPQVAGDQTQLDVQPVDEEHLFEFLEDGAGDIFALEDFQ